MSIRNAALGIGNGVIFQLAHAAFDPETVLTAFALTLFDGNVVAVGILTSVITSGWYLPSAFLAPALSKRQRMLPVYRLGALIRVITITGLWLVVRFMSPEPAIPFFVLVAAILLAYTTAGGIGMIPFFSIVTATIPPTWRGKFFGTRWLLGGLMGFGAGFLVKYMLSDESGLQFPHNYAQLFLLAAIGMAIATGLFCLVEEPERSPQKRNLPFRVELARGPRFFRRDRNFRRATRARALFTIISGLAFPFIVPYALVSSNMTAGMVGIYLALRTLSQSLSNLLWSRISDRQGNLGILISSGWMTLGVVFASLAGPLVPALPLDGWLAFAHDTRVGYFLLLGMLLGFARGGAFLAHNNYLLELSPDRVRPTYLAFYYTVLFPLCWVPFAGSLLIGQGGRYTLAFGVAAALGILMMIDLLRLSEVRDTGVDTGAPQ